MKTKNKFKTILTLAVSLLLLSTSCEKEELDYAIINGKVQRYVNGNGIANQSVIVMTKKVNGSSIFSSITDLDRKEVVTDINGNFSISLLSDVDAFISVLYRGNEDYFGSGIARTYSIDEPLIIEVDKFIKFKIFVKNNNPFDENDFIKIDFFAGLSNEVRTGIENFGIENTYQPFPSDGLNSAWDEALWTGIDVNSIVYYSVRETATCFKVRWLMKKNNIETNGLTVDIPFDINQVSPFTFNY